MQFPFSFRNRSARRPPGRPAVRHVSLTLEPLEHRSLLSAAPGTFCGPLENGVPPAADGSTDLRHVSTASAPVVAVSSDALEGDVTLFRGGSAVQVFSPASDTDADRGTALRTALAAAQPGDELVLEPSTYDMGGDSHVEFPDGVTVSGAGQESTKITSSCPQSVDGNATFTLNNGTVIQDCWLEGSLQNGLYQPLVGMQRTPTENVTAYLQRDKITGDTDGIFVWTGNLFTYTIQATDCDISTNYDAVALLGSGSNTEDVQLVNCSLTVAQPDPTGHGISNCVNLQSGTVELNGCTLTAAGDANSVQTVGVWTWNQGASTIVNSTFDVSAPSGRVYDLYIQNSTSCTVVGGQGSGPNGSYIASSATQAATAVVAQNIFYNNSDLDGNDPAANDSDDAAIASDKTALLPGQTATTQNITSVDSGINGVMIDLAGIHGDITADDFLFTVGSNNAPSTWSAAPAPVAVTVRRGMGVGGSDRIELIWADGAIQDEWLDVTVKETSDTGLAADDVFFYGNDLDDTLPLISVPGNEPPVLNLNGNVSQNFTAYWNVGGGAASLECTANSTSGATITDGATTNLTSLTVTLANPRAGDLLTATGTGNISVTPFDGVSLVLSGSDSLASYQNVLRTIQYDNTAGGPGVDSETATFTAVDATGSVGTASAVIRISDFSTAPISSTVTARNVFYAGSVRYDIVGGQRSPLPFSDDNAIATDKIAYLPGAGAATFANMTSFVRGINGIMVDLLGGGDHTSITLANILDDFTFKVGDNNAPDTWSAAPNPVAVTVRTDMNPANNGGGAVGGSDRVELLWSDGAITQQWLEVTVRATADTGLAADDVFFFGNEIGNTGSSNSATIAKTASADITDVQTHGASLKANVPITNIYDFDKDGSVGGNDLTSALSHATSNNSGLRLIAIAADGPVAPDATILPTGDDAAVASAIATIGPSMSPSVPVLVFNRLEQPNLNHAAVDRCLANTAEEDVDAKIVSVDAGQTAEPLDFDRSGLDSAAAEAGPSAWAWQPVEEFSRL